MLPKLASIFGVSIDYLLGCAQPSSEKVYEAEIVPAREEQEKEGLHYQNGHFEFSFNSGRKGDLAIAIWVLLVGGLLLASVMLGWNVAFWPLLWQSALMVFGLAGLYPRFSVFRLGCALFGGYFLLESTGITSFGISGKLVLPICLLLFGLGLLIDAVRKPRKPAFSFHHSGDNRHRSCCNTGEESFDCSTSFGENTYFIDLPRLRRGEASVSFGEQTVDLTGVEEIAENCRLEASCSFGEMTILVPLRWKVEADSRTAFGAFEFEGQPDAAPQGVILLCASASFGVISIKYI